MELKGTVGVVTGSGSRAGIGQATAVALARAGAAGVVINYSRSEEAAQEVARQVAAAGSRPLVVQADVSQEAQVQAMVKRTIETFGRLDILVNNAAWTTRVRFDDLDGLTDEVWQRTLGVNLMGPFYCIRAAAPHLKERRGVVVNITSIGGLRAVGSSSAAYCAAKAGLINLTMTLARGLAPDIRVNAVCPGFVDGQWMQSPEHGLGDRYEQTLAKTTQKIPLKRVSSPEDVADAVLALCRLDMVTGHNLLVDGGYSIRD